MTEKSDNSGTPKPCSLRLVRKGRHLTGTSAQIAYISDRGGWDVFLHETATEVVAIFLEELEARAPYLPPKRPNLRVVGGKL